MMRIAISIVLGIAGVLGVTAHALADESKMNTKAIEMKGIDLYLHAAEPTFGQLQDPTFWVHAARGQSQNDSYYLLEGAKAVIYRETEEDLILAANSGTFDRDNKSAQLAGGVRVTSGNLVVDLEEIAWDETKRVARSESVAKLSDGANEIVGNSIAIFPDDDRVELGGGTAKIVLAAVEPESESTSSATDKYTRLDIVEQHGTSGSIKGAPLEKIQGPVRMVLVGKTPADTLTIAADLVTLEYGDDGSRKPTRVSLTGHVHIKQQTSEVSANSANLDLAASTAKFKGDVVFSGEGISNASGPSLDLNLDTGEWVLGGPGGVISYDFSAPKPAAKDGNS